MARETSPEITPHDLGAAGDGAGAPPYTVDDEYRLANETTTDRLWWAAGVVYRAKWWIMALTVLVAAASVYLTLQLPNEYRAETRVLLPESGSGGLLAGALSNLPPAAAALLGGGGGGGFTRYMAILESRTTLETIVDQFDLVQVYDLEDEDFPRQDAIGELSDRAEFEVNIDFDYLGISVLDESPERSAQLANYFVERLNERYIEFQASSAAENREFLSDRLDQANLDLDDAQARMQELQERTGVVQPTAQAEALFSSIGQAQAEVSTAEVAYRSLLSQFGPENPDVQAARAGLEAARSQVQRLTGGSEVGLPSVARLPGVQRQYAEVMQDLEIQRAIIETIQPLYEQAALQEQRDADAVQVLDPAIPPTKKSEPGRSIIVIGATLSAFLVGIALVLGIAMLRAHGPAVFARLRAA
ncbi:GumC family protein [Rubrivirga sp.]|uniref:GumC family protein n=1 Tax=Rubrivirga sp. TaxID=1885344 RepID=UPI003C787196